MVLLRVVRLVSMVMGMAGCDVGGGGGGGDKHAPLHQFLSVLSSQLREWQPSME